MARPSCPTRGSRTQSRPPSLSGALTRLHSYITPPGTGFLPRETAAHHQAHVVGLVRRALAEAGVRPSDLDCLCYTRGPGMGGCLVSVAVVVRVLAQLWGKPARGGPASRSALPRSFALCLALWRLSGRGLRWWPSTTAWRTSRWDAR